MATLNLNGLKFFDRDINFGGNIIHYNEKTKSITVDFGNYNIKSFPYVKWKIGYREERFLFFKNGERV